MDYPHHTPESQKNRHLNACEIGLIETVAFLHPTLLRLCPCIPSGHQGIWCAEIISFAVFLPITFKRLKSQELGRIEA